ncbi:flotillin family protein [Actinoplanes sp. NBRC 103695]|uniref:flotillin family protein n=1 Tax=Actinoplanes sp. NBRC 103695 TaxID=3032202 RepID=UPI0024A4CDF9|nr:flotillin family protein [Actinoplanes sp. NBRC 103695]GLY97466.1 flotillin [Actinoplanes sp. NBRC 103695]
MSVLIAAAGGALFVLFVVMSVLSRIKVAGPNEAFIITGRRGRSVTDSRGGRSTDMSGQKVVMGASVFVVPVVQRKQSLDLSSRRISVDIQGAVSKQGIRANLHGVAIVKVGGTEDAVRAAAQRFLHQQKEIEQFTREVLAGSLRAIVGRLTVEEIIGDRVAFANAVAEEAEHSMTNQGLVLDTFQVQDILTEGSYLQDLGRPEAARILKDAAVAEARATQASEEARLLAEEAIATAQRNLELKKASIRAEVDAAQARAALAGPLAKAEQEQGIISEQQKVAERRAELKQRELDIEVRRPAEAERYRVEQAAEAERARRSALAEAAEREGLADGAAVLARGRGDAEAMRLKAAAFAQYGEAAVLDLLSGVLPQVVEAASRPIGAIDKMTVISTDGASTLTRSVANNVAQGLQLGTDLTGVDFAGLLGRLDRTKDAEPGG